MNTQSIENLSGASVGNYTMKRLLGTGGMSAVYQAYQHSLKRFVAVKVLRPELAAQEEYVTRFIREAEIAAKLNHPNIVQIHDFGMYSGNSFIAMQMLSGGTLTDRLRSRFETPNAQFALPEISILLRQLAEALDYAHQAGVIHRDIKPSNIMFGDNQGGPAFIVDFGIAVLNYRRTADDQQVAGTYAYMAPEIWRGEAPTTLVDQYALGLIIYTMLTGKPHFESLQTETRKIRRSHLEELPIPAHLQRQGLNSQFSNVLAKAYAKNPADRYLSNVAFANAFDQAIRDLHTPTYPFASPGARIVGKPTESSGPAGDSAAESAADFASDTRDTGLTNTSGTLNLSVKPTDRDAVKHGKVQPPATPTTIDLTVVKPQQLSQLFEKTSEPGLKLSDVFEPVPAHSRRQTPPTAKILITFRKGDVDDAVRRISNKLRNHFGENVILDDLTDLPLGTNIKRHLSGLFRQGMIVLNIVGPNWIHASDLAAPRDIDRPGDLVRLALEAAIESDATIIPIYVENSSLPSRLPMSLQSLENYTGMSLGADAQFNDDVTKLIISLNRQLNKPR